MSLNRIIASAAIAVALTSSSHAQTGEAGLPALQQRRQQQQQATAPAREARTRANARLDLVGAWTGDAPDPVAKEAGTPGSFTFSRSGRQQARDTYAIRVVASTEAAVAPSTVTGTFDGTQLTIVWTPTGGMTGRVAAIGSATRQSAPETRTLVYTHSQDDDFDRLTRASGSELPGGVQAPSELRRLRPPQVIFPAEWETSEEILWGYRNAYAVSRIYVAAIGGCARNGETIRHRIYVASAPDQLHLDFELAEALDDSATRLVTFQVFAFGTVWMRDYGPWTVRRKSNGQRAVGDMGYFSDRPNDDSLPVDYSRLRGWERLDLSSLKIEGGNIMSDGRGKLFTTIRTLEGTENGANDAQDEVEASLRRVGASEVLFFERMPEPEGTGHIDMFAKLMDERTVLVGRHEDPLAGAVLDRNAARFAALGYRVERIDFARPDHVTGVEAPGLPLMTYTNSLFVGRTVLVTSYGDVERDAAAAAVYRRLGWNPVMIDVRSIIGANGAIHCISMQVPAR